MGEPSHEVVKTVYRCCSAAGKLLPDPRSLEPWPKHCFQAATGRSLELRDSDFGRRISFSSIVAATSKCSVVEAAQTYLIANPPPTPLTSDWFGLTYINVVWQDKMVSGMLDALLLASIVSF